MAPVRHNKDAIRHAPFSMLVTSNPRDHFKIQGRLLSSLRLPNCIISLATGDRIPLMWHPSKIQWWAIWMAVIIGFLLWAEGEPLGALFVATAGTLLVWRLENPAGTGHKEQKAEIPINTMPQSQCLPFPFCVNCGTAIEGAWKFCPQCGTSVVVLHRKEP